MNPQDEQSSIEHLEDLRKHIIRSLCALAILSIVAYIFNRELLDIFLKPLHTLGNHSVHFFSPQEAFVSRLKVALGSALMVGVPYFFWEIWRFVLPGLHSHERKMMIPLLFGSSLLFALGVSFAYFVILPISLKFFLSFGTESLRAMISIKQYIQFSLMILMAFGVMFLLPIGLTILVKLGIASPEFLAHKRKFALLLILVLSALITPPDIFTQLLLALPIYGLYEASIFVAKLTSK